MEKLKYDSLYKFIVSIGIAIIVLPFILMYILLNNNDLVIIKENEINHLTNTAKEIVLLEQNYKYIILSKPIIFSIVSLTFILMGFIIVVYGIIQWKNKVQKYEDKSRELSNKLLEKQIKGLTNAEKKEKLKEDIDISENTDTDSIYKDISIKINNQQISKYLDIQRNVYRIIRNEFKDYKIFEEVRLKKQMYDCIALHTSEDYFYDYIFEIKFFTKISAIKGKIKRLEMNMLEKEMIYCENSNRYAKTVLIIMIENFSEKDRLENKKILDEISDKSSYMSQIIVADLNTIEEELKRIWKM